MRLGEVVSSVPTIGFNVETVQHKNFLMTVWDVGGQDRIRLPWKHYFENTDAIIFVVDANDPDRITEASIELSKAMTDHCFTKSPLRGLVVLANKMDLPLAVSVGFIDECLNLKQYNVPYHVQETCAITGSGLIDVLDNIQAMLAATPRQD